MNRQLLEQPFSADQIKQRDGGLGRAIDYIEGHSVIQRLNDAFESAWSFEIISHEIHQEEVVVIGNLPQETWPRASSAPAGLPETGTPRKSSPWPTT